ncbi:hypothetical protein CAEBREN_18084 [Caenorhabditis brenneri]|uniref:Serpentine Receptor, class H n=1 Tax=Caenorhabditis brenneri TaxID=135651 RepID=G0M942_CAEBE|nr:hypothetical protein CAEBREN_18084 [Caenorhabditis brenneri]
MYSIIEIPVHILGTYCILFKTPKSMESVKWNMLAIQVFIVSAAIVCLFESRFYLLCAKTSWWRCARYPFLVSQYLIAFASFLPVISLIPDQKQALEVLQKKFPQIPLSQYSPSLFIISLDGYAPFLSIVLTGAIMYYEVVLFCVLLFLKMRKNVVRVTCSNSGYELQKKFLIAIFIQNSVPFLTLVLPAFYFRFSMNWSYYNQFLNNLCMIMVSLHGVMSTIMMILVHDPYRNAVKSMMDLRGFWRN